MPDVVTSQYDGYTLLYTVKGCGSYEDHEELMLVVNDVPDIASAGIGALPSLLCDGATLDVVLPPDLDFEWQRNGVTFLVGSNGDPFSVGTYQICYRVGNECGWSDYSDPHTLTVSQGLSFNMPQSWQEALEVCEGESLGQESVPDAYTFVDNLGQYDDLLGWFLRPADGSTPFAWDLDNPIPATYDGYRLVYGVKASCQDVEYYGPGKPILVIGAPVIDQDWSSINILFCDGDPVEVDDPTLNVHPNDQVSEKWEIMLPGSTDWIGLPQVWSRETHDGAVIRYTATSTKCSSAPAIGEPLEVFVNAEPSVDAIPDAFSLCAEGPLAYQPEVEWNQLVPGDGYWQVSDDGVGGWSTVLNGYMFDPGQVDNYFQGKYVRYVADGFCGSPTSNVAQLSLLQSADVHITGTDHVAVSNSYWPGVYYYYTDVDEPLTWTLDPKIWEVYDTIINGKSCCRLTVNTMGSAMLTAQVGDGSCGKDVIYLNAVQFNLAEHEVAPVSVFPNPAHHSVTIKSVSITNVYVYNVIGQRVKTIEAHGNDQVSFTVEDLAESLYIVEVQSQKGAVRRTMTVVK